MSIKKIKNSKEFSLVYNNSKKIYTKYAIVFVRNNEHEEQRFGFVASKKTGNAVQRNRIKRLFREYIRLNKNKFNNNYDIILVGKQKFGENIDKIKYEDIEKDLNRIFKLSKII